MSEKDYSKLSGKYFDYKPFNLDKNDMFVRLQSDDFNIIGYGYVIEDGNKFMKYLDKIVDDKAKLDIFDTDKNFKFEIEDIIKSSGDKTLDDIAGAKHKFGIYLGSLRIQSNYL